MERSRDGAEVSKEAVLGQGDEQRIYDVRVSSLFDWRSQLVSRVVILHDITERKRAEEALKASQEYTKSIIDSSLDMIIAVDMDRHIVEFNKAAQVSPGGSLGSTSRYALYRSTGGSHRP